MKLGIIGGGTVGRAIARTYMEHHSVWVYDHVPERCVACTGSSLSEDTDLIFVCLPTEVVLEQLKEYPSSKERADIPFGLFYDSSINLVLKSTVPIGTTKRLSEVFKLPNLVHSPEFLTARCALADAQAPARNIIGLTDNGFNAPLLHRLYLQRFPGIQTLTMSSNESEAVKLFLNAFFAVKVSFFNEIRTLSDFLNLDWDTILEGMLSDGRIAHSHTQVPGPDGMYGFGGTCLPRDLDILVDQMQQADLFPYITTAAIRRNRMDRREGDKS